MTDENKTPFKTRTTPLAPKNMGLEATFWGMESKEIGEKVGLKHSSQLMLFVAQCQTYPSGDIRSLAITIADHYNPGFGYAFPTHERLAELLGVSTDTIIRWMKQLVATDYWEVRKGAQGRATTYSPSTRQFAILADWIEANNAGQRYGDDVQKVAPVFNRGANGKSITKKKGSSTTTAAGPLLLDAGTDSQGLTVAEVVLVNTLMEDFYNKNSFPETAAASVQNAIIRDLIASREENLSADTFSTAIRSKVADRFPVS